MDPGYGGLQSFSNGSSPKPQEVPRDAAMASSPQLSWHTLTWEPQTWPARLCSRNHPPALELHKPLGRSWKAPWLAPAQAVAASPPLPASSSPHIPAVHLENKVEESRTTSMYLQSDWCKLHPEAEQAYRYTPSRMEHSFQSIVLHCSHSCFAAESQPSLWCPRERL